MTSEAINLGTAAQSILEKLYEVCKREDIYFNCELTVEGGGIYKSGQVFISYESHHFPDKRKPEQL